MSAETDAIIDVLADIGEQTDSMSAEQAIAAYEAATDVIAAARTLQQLAETQLKIVLEQPVRIGQVTYEVVDDWKWKPDHTTIKSNVVSAAVHGAEDVERAAHRAVELAYQLFVSPSAMPKITGLRSLGLGKDDVADCELNGRRLRVTDNSAPGGAR